MADARWVMHDSVWTRPFSTLIRLAYSFCGHISLLQSAFDGEKMWFISWSYPNAFSKQPNAEIVRNQTDTQKSHAKPLIRIIDKTTRLSNTSTRRNMCDVRQSHMHMPTDQYQRRRMCGVILCVGCRTAETTQCVNEDDAAPHIVRLRTCDTHRYDRNERAREMMDRCGRLCVLSAVCYIISCISGIVSRCGHAKLLSKHANRMIYALVSATLVECTD